MPKQPEAMPEGYVTVRITKFGDGKVSTGQDIVGVGDIFAKKDDTLVLPLAIATELEKRALAEIVD